MEKILEQSLLYDFYGELLTDHQKSIYEDFVLNDLSLGEIAEEREISRQGVYDTIKRCNKLLEGYEKKLHLMERFAVVKAKVESIHDNAEKILSATGDDQVRIASAREIEQLSGEIIDAF